MFFIDHSNCTYCSKVSAALSCRKKQGATIDLFFSFSTLDPNEVGIEYDTVSEKINDEELYETGRHFLGACDSKPAQVLLAGSELGCEQPMLD